MWMRRIVLKPGDRNPAVGVLQERLSLLGYRIEDEENFFGTTTREAVMAFQQVCGLPADGIVQEKTWQALYAATGGSACEEFLLERKYLVGLQVIPGGKREKKTVVTAHSRYIKYVVQPGDTLGKLARRFRTTPQKLAELNHLTPASLIFPGETLIIPE